MSTTSKRSYTVAFKLDAISYAEATSNRKAALFYKVDRKRVQEWRKDKEKFEAVRNDKDSNINQVRVLAGRGRKAKYPELEKELLGYRYAEKSEMQHFHLFLLMHNLTMVCLYKRNNVTIRTREHLWRLRIYLGIGTGKSAY